MINNNPYIVPEKPMRQSKIVIEPTPLFPHQINRPQEDHDHKFSPHILKRSTLPYFLEGQSNDHSRVPMSPQLVRGQYQQPNGNGWQAQAVRELTQRLGMVTSRLDAQERKLSFLMDSRKHQQSTALSDSIFFSHDYGTPYASKQMERHAPSSETLSQSSSGTLDRLKEEMSLYKLDKDKLEEALRAQMNQQKQMITHQLLTSFKQCLTDKFQEEERKIASSIAEFSYHEEKKLENRVSELREEFGNQVRLIYDTLSSFKLEQSYKEQVTTMLRLNFDQISQSLKDLELNQSTLKDEASKNNNFRDEILELKHSVNQLKLKTYTSTKAQLSSQVINVSYEQSSTCIQLTYEQYCRVIEKGKEQASLHMGHRKYFIDREGYLLDQHHCYLLGSNGRIKLAAAELEKLREVGILHE